METDLRRGWSGRFRGPLVRVLLLVQLAVAPALAEPVRRSLMLAAPGGREVSVQVLRPQEGCDPCDLIVFSHGAFAAPERYDRLLMPWAEAGYLVAAPLHVDSELHPERDRYDGDQTRVARLEDFGLLAGTPALARALAAHGQSLSGRVVASGHSYGALIAQLAAGATLAGEQGPLPEIEAARPALDGVVALSPPGPFGDVIGADNWATVNEPMLVVTGTADILPGFVDDWRSHLVSFESARRQPSYALVYSGQDHYFNGAFGRPKAALDDADAAAMASLNDQVLDFLRRLRHDALPAPAQWTARSGALFEARVAAATANFFD
jgi:dienelactone hydrolase